MKGLVSATVFRPLGISPSLCSTSMVYSPPAHWHDAKRRHHPPREGNHGEAHWIRGLSVQSGGALAQSGDPRRGRGCLCRCAGTGLRRCPQPARGRLGQ